MMKPGERSAAYQKEEMGKCHRAMLKRERERSRERGSRKKTDTNNLEEWEESQERAFLVKVHRSCRKAEWSVAFRRRYIS